MTKLTSQETITALSNLIGDTYPTGDSVVDKDRVENLRTLIDVTDWCLEGVKAVYEAYNTGEWSLLKAKCKASCALMEWRDWINEVFDDDQT